MNTRLYLRPLSYFKILNIKDGATFLCPDDIGLSFDRYFRYTLFSAGRSNNGGLTTKQIPMFCVLAKRYIAIWNA